MTELKPEPGNRSRRPWWLYAILSGASAGVAIVTALGLGGAARGQEPHVATASVVLPAGTLSLDERLERMEKAINGLEVEVREMRDRLPPKH